MPRPSVWLYRYHGWGSVVQVVALYNGGPAGAIYELFVHFPIFSEGYSAYHVPVLLYHASTCSSLLPLPSWHQPCRRPAAVRHHNQFRKMSIVLLTTSIVYHWASITGGRYGRSCGWFAGWWNFLGWLVGTASMSFILGNQTVSMYAAFHPTLVVQRWHVFVSYLICTWICCATVLLANRALPILGTLGIYFVVVGVGITIVVCAVMPHVNGAPYASNASVWADWDNRTGYSSDGFVFLAGMLNGAYAVGCPDCVSHLAEEIPK